MATNMYDIQLDGSDDVNIVNGDFAITESTEMHQKQLLINDKGAFKENPTICVGIYGYIDDEGPEQLIRDINIEFTRDGMVVNFIQATFDANYQPNLKINADYA